MKPLHIALLIAAGAVGGAVVMQVWQRPRPVTTSAPAVARVQQPAAQQAQQPLPVEAPPQVQPQPEPAPAATAPASVERPVRSHRVAKPARPQPVKVAKSEPPPVAAPVPPAAVQQPAKETQPAPEPPPTPPARTEPEQVTPPPPPRPEPHRVTLNTGTLLPVRLVDGLSSERNMPGDTFMATLDKELVVDGFVIAERGARVEGRVVSADRAGKVRGVAALSVELTRLHTSDGQNLPIQTERFDKQSEPTHTQDAEKVAAGAAVGAIIGAIAGGGKGAAIGAGVGGGAGAGDVLLTRGKPATLPSETRISFRLRAPVTVTEKVY